MLHRQCLVSMVLVLVVTCLEVKVTLPLVRIMAQVASTKEPARARLIAYTTDSPLAAVHLLSWLLLFVYASGYDFCTLLLLLGFYVFLGASSFALVIVTLSGLFYSYCSS